MVTGKQEYRLKRVFLPGPKAGPRGKKKKERPPTYPDHLYLTLLTLLILHSPLLLTAGLIGR